MEETWDIILVNAANFQKKKQVSYLTLEFIIANVIIGL